MFPSFLLSLREGLEAALILGIVLGALQKMRRTHLKPAVWAGVGLASVLSLVLAVTLAAFGLSLEGVAEAIFEGITMFLAAGVLTWMIFWMSRQARNLRRSLEGDVHRAAAQSGQRGVFALAFLAVFREGVELALFLTASIFTSTALQVIGGASFGLGTAIVLGWLIFSGARRLDLRRFFQVTSVLLLLFAAGLVAHGVHEFNEVGWIPPIIEHVWDLNPVLDENSVLGSLLKALFGYNGNPSLSEVLTYLLYFIGISFRMHRENRSAKPLSEANVA